MKKQRITNKKEYIPDQQLMVYAYLHKSNNDKRKQTIALCKRANRRLKDLGYKVICFNKFQKGNYFLTIFKKEKRCGWNPSIHCACCMGSLDRAPISIETFIKLFDLIMDPKMNKKCWELMEQIAYQYGNQ